MARPTKQGIDYFPLDCQFDDKIEMYLIEKGAIGLGVLISIWQMIYSNEGYYIENGKDLYLLIKRKINVDVNEVSDCINVCLGRNIFDYSIHKRNKILTSKAIQKRYFEAGKKKKEVKIIKKFMLIDVSAYDNLINVDINPINVSGNATNVNVKEEEEVKEKNYSRNFEETWERYPVKDGKKKAKIHFLASVKNEKDLKDINIALDNYLNSGRIKNGYIKNGSTWFNNWQDWINWKEPKKDVKYNIMGDIIAEE